MHFTFSGGGTDVERVSNDSILNTSITTDGITFNTQKAKEKESRENISSLLLSPAWNTNRCWRHLWAKCHSLLWPNGCIDGMQWVVELLLRVGYIACIRNQKHPIDCSWYIGAHWWCDAPWGSALVHMYIGWSSSSNQWRALFTIQDMTCTHRMHLCCIYGYNIRPSNSSSNVQK